MEIVVGTVQMMSLTIGNSFVSIEWKQSYQLVQGTLCQGKKREKRRKKSCINKQDWLEKEGNGSKKCS